MVLDAEENLNKNAYDSLLTLKSIKFNGKEKNNTLFQN